MAFSNTDNFCIFGMRGAGKSTLCRKLQGFFHNVIIFDTLKEYDESDGNVFYNFDSFADFLIKTKDINGLRIINQFSIEQAFEPEIIDDYVKMIYYRGNCTVVIEEIQNFASVHKIPPFLKQCSLTGRHQNINFITTTQRIAEVHKSLLSQAHHIFSGYTDSPNDKRTLQEYGFPIQHIETINQFEFLWKNGRKIMLTNTELCIGIEKNVDDAENAT